MFDEIGWIGFLLFILALLAMDIVVFNKKNHQIKLKEALAWSVFWIILALLFNVLVYFTRGAQSALQYFTAYLVERSLSMDNLFVFMVIFTFFQVPKEYEHRVLFLGILGALVMRFLFIFAGIALIQRFYWIIYLFGAILIYSGIKLITEKDKEFHPEKNPVLKLFRRFMPITTQYYQHRFLTKIDGRWHATPLLVVLLVIETSDVIFAVDSIPAVLAISQDTFIVFTSNIMAILGLRALYFAIAGIMKSFRYLNYGLAVILVFVGIKMLVAEFYKIPIEISLGLICLILAVSILASLYVERQERG